MINSANDYFVFGAPPLSFTFSHVSPAFASIFLGLILPPSTLPFSRMVWAA
jgi:hypothetical protein